MFNYDKYMTTPNDSLTLQLPFNGNSNKSTQNHDNSDLAKSYDHQNVQNLT